MIYRTGEREGDLAHIWTIQEGYELVGFHGSMNANDEIVELGIVTRIANFPSICLDAVHDISASVERINSLNGNISSMNSDIQGQVSTMKQDVDSQFLQMNQDVDEQLNDVSAAIQTTVGAVETDFNAKIQEVESMVSDLNSKIDQLHSDIDN